MWMMGYSDGGGEINTIQDPFTGRKLRPLMPRPSATARIHGADLFALNHHLAMAEQSKRDLSAQQVVVSSRWNPTAEQLQTLEGLYRRGTRTPSAEQIQQITVQLRRYGKIEGKNVFYWFQNHKARERQKRRRQLESFPDDDKREAAAAAAEANKTYFEVEHTKNWPSPTTSSTNIAEKSGEAEAECKAADDGWLQFEEDAELQRRRNATWQMMNNLSCSSSSSSPTNLITPTLSPPPPSKLAHTTKFNTQDFINIFLEPYTTTTARRSTTTAAAEAQTLQLFPLESGLDHEEGEEESRSCSTNEINSSASDMTPCQFFEFLPLKN